MWTEVGLELTEILEDGIFYSWGPANGIETFHRHSPTSWSQLFRESLSLPGSGRLSSTHREPLDCAKPCLENLWILKVFHQGFCLFGLLYLGPIVMKKHWCPDHNWWGVCETAEMLISDPSNWIWAIEGQVTGQVQVMDLVNCILWHDNFVIHIGVTILRV